MATKVEKECKREAKKGREEKDFLFSTVVQMHKKFCQNYEL